MPRFARIALAVLFLAASLQSARAEPVERIRVEGELIDTWCYVTEIMYARGSAHYQCAVWCAVGGIPVSIRAEDGTLYVVLRVEADTRSVSNPSMVKIQSHKVTVDGDLIRRDGVNYLLVTQVADDQGVVDLTHEKFGIQPWGM
ncbi:hypothetical protein [Nisaea sediminum]|uniref:hypothetical protein n=1 Tax=Nisaea sediminum TaxID=2775867 RepID=UPI001868530A|nr:hypothetical protein [Nisaea sediminum]